MVLFCILDEILCNSLDSLLHKSFDVYAILVLLTCFHLSFLECCSNVCHVLKESHSKTLTWEFLATVHCPISVLEVVVIYAAQLLDVAVSAVVVGHKKSFL